MEIKPLYSGTLQLLIQKVTKIVVRWRIEIHGVQMDFLLPTEWREQDSLPLLQLLASRGIFFLSPSRFSSPQLGLPLSYKHSDIPPALGTAWRKAKHYYLTMLLEGQSSESSRSCLSPALLKP